MRYIFGSSPGVGCQNRTFKPKTLIHLRHNRNLPIYVDFVDLVKAFDTFNHKMVLQILIWYVTPPKLCLEIERMYTDLKVVLKI